MQDERFCRFSVLVILLLLSPSGFAAETILLDPCETAERWSAAGEPHGRVVITAGPYDPKLGEGCLRLGFESCRISWLRFEAPRAWNRSDAITFWLRADRADDTVWSFRINADASDGSFSIDAKIQLDFDGWQRVRLTRDDFTIGVRSGGAEVDFSKIKDLSFGLMEGCGKPTLYVDDLRYERRRKPDRPSAPDVVVVDRCDRLDGWRVVDLTAHTVATPRAEGTGALRLHFDGLTDGRVHRYLGPMHLSDRHALGLYLRGPGVNTSATLRVVLETPSGGRFTKELAIRNFEMRELLLFPAEFRAHAAPNGNAPKWADVQSVSFGLHSPDEKDSGSIIIDHIRFEKMAAPRPRRAPDPRFWWWDGGSDPFAAMHVIHADWPHLRSDPRPAPIKFSDIVLAPLMPYTIELFGGEQVERIHVTLTDWQTTVQDRFEAPIGPAPSVVRQLVAPPRTGSYVYHVELRDGAGQTVQTYQTGINVVAKRLREPRGLWGFHGYLGDKGSRWPHHEQLLPMLRDFGVALLRERLPFDPITAADATRPTPQRRVLKLAKTLGMTTVATLSMRHRGDLWAAKGRYNVDGMKPAARGQIVDIMASLASAYRGLVDWWEIGNEPNEHPIGPYAKVLAACYEGVQRGDPEARVVMGGSHVIDRWQVQAWEIERRTGVPHQDALATHLYPDPASLEQTMRAWITEQGDALQDKGMLMTEAGWPTFPPKTQSLHRQGLLAPGYSGERVAQDWTLRYAPVILGEHLKLGAKLHGVGFFRTTPSMGDWMLRDDQAGELYVHSKGHFVARWNDRAITMGRPMAYSHNTIARLLTHEVRRTDVQMTYDEREALVENYAFARPGETIVTLWIGVRAGGRADQVPVTVRTPRDVGLALAVDMDGNEQVVELRHHEVEVALKRDEPQYLRFIAGDQFGDVFVARHGREAFNSPADHGQLMVAADLQMELAPQLALLAKSVDGNGPTADEGQGRVYVGTPRSLPAMAELISLDRNLPVISDTVPIPGRPMVLFSPAQGAVFVVGQNAEDLRSAVAALHRMVLKSG